MTFNTHSFVWSVDEEKKRKRNARAREVLIPKDASHAHLQPLRLETLREPVKIFRWWWRTQERQKGVRKKKHIASSDGTPGQ